MPQRRVSKRRILLLTASFGGASQSAADALARYYRAHHPDEVEVKVVDFFEEFTPSTNVLAKFAYQHEKPFFPALYGTLAQAAELEPSSPLISELTASGMDRLKAYIGDYRPDGVISTSTVAGSLASEATPDILTATVITDYAVRHAWLHPATGLFFVSTRDVREELLVRGVGWERLVESGVPIHEKFAESLSREECRKVLGLVDRFTVLLTAGSGLTSVVREVAAALSGTGVQVIAAMGRHSQTKRRLETLAEDLDYLHVWGHTPDMPKMMCAADVWVGRSGGLMASEALSMGLPSVIYAPVPGQEVHNVDYLVNSGVGLLSRDEGDVAEKVLYLSGHPQRLAQMAGNAKAVGRPLAAQTVCERVLAAIR